MPGSRKSKCHNLKVRLVRAHYEAHKFDPDRQEKYSAMIARMKQHLEEKKKERVD